jgi:hypothetical protein
MPLPHLSAPVTICRSLWNVFCSNAVLTTAFGFKPPAQTPCHVLIGIRPIVGEALKAMLSNSDLRIEPQFCGVGFEASA